MRVYFGGDKNRDGFRFLRDRICIDFVNENQPIHDYLNAIISYINNNKLNKIFIYSESKEKIDLEFLNRCVHIEEVQISAFCKTLGPIYDIQPSKVSLQLQDEPIRFEKLCDKLIELDLYNITGKKYEICLNESILTCKKLKSIGVSCFRNEDLALIAQMPWLEKVSLVDYERGGSKIPNFANMKNVTALSLQRVSSDIFSIIKEFPRLNYLFCAQVPVISLDGIETLSDLQELGINYCSKLKDISAIKGCKNLEAIKFEACKHIADFNSLALLKKVKELKLFNCGEINSLKFIESIPSLEHLLFTGTNIVDGDLTPCLRLAHAETNDKRHYNMKAKDLPNKYYN